MEIGVMEFFYLLESPNRHVMLQIVLKEFEERKCFYVRCHFKVFNKF